MPSVSSVTRVHPLAILIRCSILLALMGFLLPASVDAITFKARNPVVQGSHANVAAIPQGCRTCHRGMNMMTSGEEGPCLRCHGSLPKKEQSISEGILRPLGSIDLRDIESELKKKYRHPTIDKVGLHRSGEELPETSPDTPRHAECGDCHKAHLVDPTRPFAGLVGKRMGSRRVEVQQEYELCFNCHAESLNRPADTTDKALEFATTGKSFHPVVAEGKNPRVISLLSPYVAVKSNPQDVSMVSCGDCHGSDDPNGPAGPHGSNFKGLLKRNYLMADGLPESEYAYSLCYGCHDRNSILRNESFPLHSLHIVGDMSEGKLGTSCMTCHDAHGSPQYKYLVRFNQDVVLPNAEGRLEFMEEGNNAGRGSCFLNCHGIEHNPRSY